MDEHFGWINWCAFGVLVHKIVAEESCAAEEIILRQQYDAWATLEGSAKLLSRDALRNWLGTFGNRFEAACFADTMFGLLDRDDDGFLDLNEFLIGILVVMLTTRNVPPPIPGLLRAKRQIAFRLYDEDSDGRLCRREWENLVSDNITKAAVTKPDKQKEQRDFPAIMNCVQGVTDCIAARVAGEFSLEFEREKGHRRSLADHFWDEKRHLITYDIFFEAIDRGVLVEPENLFRFGELGPSLQKKIRQMIPSAGNDFATALRFLVGGVTLTSNLVGRFTKAIPDVTSAFSQVVTPLIRNKIDCPGEVIPGVESSEPNQRDITAINSELSFNIGEEPIKAISFQSRPTGADNVDVLQGLVDDLSPASLGSSSPKVPNTGRRRGPIDFGTVEKQSPVNRSQQYSELLGRLVTNCFTELKSAQKLNHQNIWGSGETALNALYFLNERVGFHMLYRERSMLRMDVDQAKIVYFLGQINGDADKLKKLLKSLLAENESSMGLDILPPNIYIVFTGNVMCSWMPNGGDSDTLSVLSMIWTLKAAFPEQIILIRGRNEACTNMTLQQQCFDEWGQDCGLRIWNSILDAWEFAPLGCIVPEQGCVYGACLTEEIASNFDWLDRLTRPLKLSDDWENVIASDNLRADCLTAIPGDRRCMDRLKLAEAVTRSYHTNSCRSNMAAVIRLRHLMSFKWVIQDQSVCDTDISVKSKWFETSKLQFYGSEWHLDAFRGLGKESIVPRYHMMPSRCEDVTALTTSAGDGEVPDSPTDREIDLFVKSVDSMV